MTRTAKAPATTSTLKPLITKVQTLRRQVPALAEDDVWRGFLVLHGGGPSTRAMTEAQLGAVVEALHKAGAPRRPPKVASTRYADTQQMRMIRGLWLELADLGAVRDRSEAALASFVTRQAHQHIGRLSSQAAARVIEALKDWRTRVQPGVSAL